MKFIFRFIDGIANGTCETDADGKTLLHMVKATTNEKEFFDFVYPDLDRGIAMAEGMALLTLRNVEVDIMNQKIMERLEGTLTSLFSHDELDTSTEHSGTVQVLCAVLKS